MRTAQARVLNERAIPKLEVRFIAGSGAPLEEGLAAAKAENRVIASSKDIGLAITDLETYMALKKAFVCRSGDMAAYVAPGTSFREASERITSLGNGHFLIYPDPLTGNRQLFQVPEEHLDKRDALLLARHPEYSLGIDGKDRVVLASRVWLMEKLPSSSGWHPGHPVFDIPWEGESPEANHNIRYLKRIGMRVGSVDNDHGRFPFADRRRMLLDLPSSAPLGLVTAER
jgi:hypothetical protein